MNYDPPGTPYGLIYAPSWEASGQQPTGHRERLLGQHIGEARGVEGEDFKKAGEEMQVLIEGLSLYLLCCSKFASNCFSLTNFNAPNLELLCNKNARTAHANFPNNQSLLRKNTFNNTDINPDRDKP